MLLLTEGYVEIIPSKTYGHHPDLVDRYENSVTATQMTTYMFQLTPTIMSSFPPMRRTKISLIDALLT